MTRIRRLLASSNAVQALVYSALVLFLRVVTGFFFRSIEVVGLEHVPKDGPVIFTGNHPNSLVDPVVITTTCRRRVRFAARDGLFATPIRPILWALGSVPIKRRQDQSSDTKQVDNQDAFSALHAVLKRGEAFGIFPEGVTYTEPELQPLKTGAARIALSAFAEGIPVRVIPVGLHYRRRDRFRGRVLVQFGRPITLDAGWMEEWKRDARETARKLTQEIELGLRALTLNAPDFDTLRVLDAARRLYVPATRDLSHAEEAEITRRLVQHWEAKKDVPEVRAFYGDVENLVALRDALGISDGDLSLPMSRWEWSKRVMRHVVLMLVWVPLALPGLLLHLPILWLATRAGELVIERDDVKATLRMVVGTLGVMFVHLATGALALALDPTPGGALRAFGLTCFLFLSGIAAIRVLERQAIVFRGLHMMTRILALKDQLASIQAQRDALRRRIPALVEANIDPSIERIVRPEELRAPL